MAHREVHLLARKVNMVKRGGDAQFYSRVRLGKMAEPVHQPFGGEVGRGRDCQHARVLPLQQPLGADGDAVERVAHDGEIIAPGLGDDQALPLAVEQFYCKLCFQRLDLMADRALRDAKLFSRARKALVPRGGFEGFQGIERWQAWAHLTYFMRKTRAGTRNDALRGNTPQHY